MLKASLFTRSKNGLQAWPDDRTTIQIPAKCEAEVMQHFQTKDSAIRIPAFGQFRHELAIYIPRGGSVVIEAMEVSNA